MQAPHVLGAWRFSCVVEVQPPCAYDGGMRVGLVLVLLIACSSKHGAGVDGAIDVAADVPIDAAPPIHPVVAWEDDNPGNEEIYVRMWNGSAWQELAASASGGGISMTSGRSEQPVVALMADG